MEASVPAGNTEMALAYRYLAIAMLGEALQDKCPLVGVGLVYTPPYIPKVAFSTAYMHLNEWHSMAAAGEASDDRLVGTHLLLVQITGESQFFPVTDGHPVLLDVVSTEAACTMKGPILPLSLRGFQLYTLMAEHQDGCWVREVAFPCLQGGTTSVFIDYEKEHFPVELGQHQPMEVALSAPSPDHWNIAMDKIFPETLAQSRNLQETTASTSTQADAQEAASMSKGQEAAPGREQILKAA